MSNSQKSLTLEESAYLQAEETENVHVQVRRHRHQSNNVRIRTGGKLHKFKDTHQTQLKQRIV